MTRPFPISDRMGGWPRLPQNSGNRRWRSSLPGHVLLISDYRLACDKPMLFSRLPSRLSGVILSILLLGGGIQKQRFLS